MALSKVAPLAWNAPIVDEHGNPTPYFQRQLAQLLNEKAATDALAEGAVPNTTQVIAGTGLSGGGALSADVTLNVDTAAEAERIRDIIGTALVAGSNITITVNDGSDTITIASSGGAGGGATAYNVATATDAFISVPLDSDNGKVYEGIIFSEQAINPNALTMRLSTDNGATFKTGASDYKSILVGVTSRIYLASGAGTSRPSVVKFTLTGMNGGATPTDFAVVGHYHNVANTGTIQSGICGGSKNALVADDYNAFIINGDAALNNTTLWLRKII